MVKILALGNEFIEQDSFAKQISLILQEKLKKEIINIKDSFQFLDILQNSIKENQEVIVLDVVDQFKQVHMLTPEDLKESSVLSAHDLDASFFIQLLKPDESNIKIIGLPQKPRKEDVSDIIEEVKGLIEGD